MTQITKLLIKGHNKNRSISSCHESHPCTTDRPRRLYTGLGPQMRSFSIQQVSCLFIQFSRTFVVSAFKMWLLYFLNRK